MLRPPLAGRHALVTGGARGIGAAVTHSLLAHGARVTMLGRRELTLTEASKTFGQFQLFDYVQADVGDPGDVDRAFADVRERWGAVNILVNNAGHAESAPFSRTDRELWHRMMAVNLDGAFHCAQACVAHLRASGAGTIVRMRRAARRNRAN